jgi:hypothetical protein
MVFEFLTSLVLEKINEFLLASWKTLIFLGYIHCQLSEQFSESQAGFGTTFKGTGGNQKAGTSSLKRVT